MENETLLKSLSAALQWLGGGFVLLFATLKVGDLTVKFFERLWKKRDSEGEIHATNQAKQIEFDIVAFQKMSERLEKVEAKLEEMQDKYTSQAVKNERLTTENEHLKTELQRSEKQIETLTEENKKQGLKIINLENALNRTQKDLEETQKEFKELNRRFERLPKP